MVSASYNLYSHLKTYQFNSETLSSGGLVFAKGDRLAPTGTGQSNTITTPDQDLVASDGSGSDMEDKSFEIELKVVVGKFT